MDMFFLAFSQVERMNNIDPADHASRLAKLAEEFGELAKEVNKTIGRKDRSKTETDESIKKEITSEAADVIQNVLSLVEGYKIRPNEILEALIEKNVKWEEVVARRKANEK